MKKKLKLIFDILCYIFMAVIALLLAYVLLMKARGQQVFTAGYATIYVQTGSMEPEIPTRSYILIRQATAQDVEVDDVITFESDDPAIAGALNTHRVVSVSADRSTFETKGDANPTVDPVPAQGSKIVGKYVRKLPVLTSVGRVLSTKIGVIITSTVLFALLLLLYLPDMMKITEKNKEILANRRQAQMDEMFRAEMERLKAEDAAKQAQPINAPVPEPSTEENNSES